MSYIIHLSLQFNVLGIISNGTELIKMTEAMKETGHETIYNMQSLLANLH